MSSDDQDTADAAVDAIHPHLHTGDTQAAAAAALRVTADRNPHLTPAQAGKLRDHADKLTRRRS